MATRAFRDVLSACGGSVTPAVVELARNIGWNKGKTVTSRAPGRSAA